MLLLLVSGEGAAGAFTSSDKLWRILEVSTAFLLVRSLF
jgi:hypothetical protein